MGSEITDNMKGLFPEPPVLQGERLVLRPLGPGDAKALSRFTSQTEVYTYLPTFLYEKRYGAQKVIENLYDEGLDESLILGIFEKERFLGLGEIYGFRCPIHKASVGYRLLREEWGKGYATETLRLLTKELSSRGIEIITASTMVENRASARVLQKAGFVLVNSGVDEDWGFPAPTSADKWIL
ncbi:MAG TPA: hypothetical protein DCW41_06720 [Clostridiales bacterium]|nr:hypothetical protein [Clostridiales bacterium]